MTEQEKFQAKIDEILEPVVDLLKPVVAEIEASMPATMNHYGAYYMSILLTAQSMTDRKIMAAGLIRAGANEQGVRDALKLVT